MTTRLLILGACLSALALSQPSKSGINLYSTGKEAELGRTLARQFRTNLTVIQEPGVGRLGRLLARHADTTFDYRFLVFDDTANPVSPPSLALPHEPVRIGDEPISVAGGWIFVPESLVSRTGDEPQLAAILAHSMSHAAMRHATHLATMGSLMQVGVDELPDRLPAVVPVSASLAIPAVLSQAARQCELQADAMAVAILTGAGYEPRALIDYIRTLPSEGRLSSMPLPALRISRIEALLQARP